ncbi:hypothetical protein F4782DRAFT_530182 [Xylaria castorea]|nr:hypothetical protein F4782DRAFT_530182 [Xylaria castorea]
MASKLYADIKPYTSVVALGAAVMSMGLSLWTLYMQKQNNQNSEDIAEAARILEEYRQGMEYRQFIEAGPSHYPEPDPVPDPVPDPGQYSKADRDHDSESIRSYKSGSKSGSKSKSKGDRKSKSKDTRKSESIVA